MACVGSFPYGIACGRLEVRYVVSVYTNAPEMCVLCQAGSNGGGPRVRQGDVNYARWNVILIVALEDDKRERREGCFAAGRPRSERVFYYHC